MASGFNKSAQEYHTNRLCEDVAQQLNSLGKGGFKDWKGLSSLSVIR